MDALTFSKSVTAEELALVCDEAGTNVAYFRQCMYGHRKFSPELVRRLVRASGGRLKRELLRPDIYADDTRDDECAAAVNG